MIDPSPASPGALLRAARERQGLHIAALAAAIKVTPRKLEALEADRFDELPDPTFTRALAQTVCRALKIDAQLVLALLPQADPSALEHVGGRLNTPFRDRPGRDVPGGLAGAAVRPMAWAGALLLVAAAVVALLPDGAFERTPVEEAAAPSTPATPAVPSAGVAPASTAVAPAGSAGPAAPAAPDPAASVAADAAVRSPTGFASTAASSSAGPASTAPSFASASGPAATLPPAFPAAGTVAATPPSALVRPFGPAAVAPAASAPAAAEPASGAAPLLLRASATSWIEVRDGRGGLLLSRTLRAGESAAVAGAGPFRLTIGNAPATEVVLRGRPVDLAAATRDSVARLELP